MLRKAGLTDFETHKEIDLGLPIGITRPDIWFDDPEFTDAAVAIYLDGLNRHIHGNAETARRDRAIRERLRARDWTVIEIAVADLDDPKAMADHLARITRVVLGRHDARRIKTERDWFTIGLSVADRSIRFEHLERIIVEPVEINGIRLVDRVRASLAVAGADVPIDDRSAMPLYTEQAPAFAALVRWAAEQGGKPGDVAATIPDELREWYAGLGKAQGAVDRWGQYVEAPWRPWQRQRQGGMAMANLQGIFMNSARTRVDLRVARFVVLLLTTMTSHAACIEFFAEAPDLGAIPPGLDRGLDRGLNRGLDAASGSTDSGGSQGIGSPVTDLDLDRALADARPEDAASLTDDSAPDFRADVPDLDVPPGIGCGLEVQLPCMPPAGWPTVEEARPSQPARTAALSAGRLYCGPLDVQCGGVLVDTDLFLTAGRCAPPPGSCDALRIVLGPIGGEIIEAGCDEVLENRAPLADYALIRLDRRIDVIARPATLDLEPPPDEPYAVTMLYQPLALGLDADTPLRVVSGQAVIQGPVPRPDAVSTFSHDIPAGPGAIGSGLFSAEGHLIGLHMGPAGVCEQDEGERTGLPIREIVAASAVLTSLTGRCPGRPNDDCVPRYTQIRAGFDYTCAITIEGTARCWGDGGDPLPTDVRFEALDLDSLASCGVVSGGRTIRCSDPERDLAAPAGRRFVDLTTGYYGTCGLLDDGRVVCNEPPMFPQVALPVDLRAHDLAAGDEHVCVIEQVDRTIRCFGRSLFGEGNEPPGRFEQVEARDHTTCALREDGRVLCWGGHEQNILVNVPAGAFEQIALGESYACARAGERVQCWGEEEHVWDDAMDIAIGFSYICVLRTDGSATCTGNDFHGRARPPASIHHAEVSAGLYLTCGRRLDGRLDCFGNYADNGEAPISGAMISVGTTHACTLASDGRLACWFHFDEDPPPGRFSWVDAGDYATCAIDAVTGEVTCWGEPVGWGEPDWRPPEPDWGFPIPPVPEDLAEPLQPPAGRFIRVAVGQQHACGIRDDGRLACWGTAGAVANGPPAGRFTAVDAGYDHSCAIRADEETVVCWGDNDSDESVVPPELTNIRAVQVVTGRDVSCLRTASGWVRCWGSIGEPPVGVFAHITAGRWFACGADLRGGLRCWGRDQQR